MNVTILKNARIYTGKARHPWAHAMAILGGRITGLDQEAIAWEDAPGARSTDMGGALIIPGLVDAHIHLMWYALSLREVDLRDTSREEMREAVAQRAAQAPPGTWITGRGWDQNLWAAPSFPTATELDGVAPRHPVALIAKSAHALVANSAALRAAGVSAQTPDPEHGRLGRDAQGNPDGMFFEDAMDLIKDAIPAPDMATLLDLLEEAQTHLLRLGITGVHDVDGNPAFAAFQELQRQERLRLRVVKYVRRAALDALVTAGVRSGLGNDHLRMGGLKLFADGALGARTAAMLTPYQGEPDNVGMLTLTPEHLEALARKAASHGIALAIHAIGDRTNRLVLDILAAVRPLNPHLRHRIEHVQLIAPEDQPRLAQWGLVASMQPIHAVHDRHMADRYWGARSRNAYAWRSLKQAGAVLAFGSDAPIEVFDPFAGLHAAVTRRDERDPDAPPWYPEEALTLEEALRAYTWGAAYAAGMEAQQGLLWPGYYADLAVLDRDIFTAPAAALLETRVRRVMIGGEWVQL